MVNAKFVKIIQMLYVMTFQFYHTIHQIQTGEQNLVLVLIWQKCIYYLVVYYFTVQNSDAYC